MSLALGVPKALWNLHCESDGPWHWGRSSGLHFTSPFIGAALAPFQELVLSYAMSKGEQPDTGLPSLRSSFWEIPEGMLILFGSMDDSPCSTVGSSCGHAGLMGKP